MPRYRFRQVGDVQVGSIDIEVPHAPGKLTVSAVGDNKADALGRAALIAERIASDPVMRALMPPQAMVAIKAAKGLSAAAKRGSRVLRHFWGGLRGPGKRRLAQVLHTEAVQEEKQTVSDVAGLRSGLRRLGRKVRRKKTRRAPPNRLPRERPEAPEAEAPEAEMPDAPEQDSPDDSDEGGEE